MGWLQDLPWFHVAVGVILSGAGMMTWLVQFDEWRSRNRVEHKLSQAGIKIHLTQVDNKVVAIRFGFNLRNTAAFPISFRIEDLKTHLTIGNNLSVFPPSKEYQNKVISVPPQSIGWFFDHNITLPNGFNGQATAYLKCKLSYGKAERFDHELAINKNTAIFFLGPSISGGEHWYDIQSGS